MYAIIYQYSEFLQQTGINDGLVIKRNFNNNIRNKENFANYCIENKINLFSKNRQNPNNDKCFN